MVGVPALGDLRARNRSVDDISAYSDGTMNVWQALEVISGNNLRKKYHYDGYSDSENVLRTLTNSTHRRESFADKVKSQEQSKKFGDGAGDVEPKTADHVDRDVVHTDVTKDIVDKRDRSRSSVTVTKRKTKGLRIVDDAAKKDEMLLLTLECTDLVQCSFNIPRISARLERLMGTNVVRLTDRKYMKELRERIDEDYRMQLSNRIKNREIKELERERNLILEGKTDTIPDELSADPIFVVNKKANLEIVKRRAKLKTNREKNADRLLRQGLKWERERSRHEEQERRKQKELARIAQEQHTLEEQYKEEDAHRGLDLLRINDAEWQECEQSLRDFLESERNKMKERSLLVPQPYSSDPQDIQNIIRARKKFRETEQRIRNQLEKSQKPKSSARVFASKVSMLISAIGVFASKLDKETEEVESHVSIYLGDDDASGIPSSSGSLQRLPGPQTSDIKQQKINEMESQVEADAQKGNLVTKDQYSHLRYDDLQIAKLRNAANIRELYQIAEKIIIGEVDDELTVGEELDVEEEDNDDML